MLKLGNCNLKDQAVLCGQYRKRRRSRDSSLTRQQFDRELDSLVRLKSRERWQENNNKESIENKYNQRKEYNLENTANKREKAQRILTLKMYATGSNVEHVATYKT